MYILYRSRIFQFFPPFGMEWNGFFAGLLTGMNIWVKMNFLIETTI